MTQKKIKVLITDDSLVFRSFLSNTLKKDPEIEVVGTAMHGKAALTTIPFVKPDVVTLDIEMPELNGLETLKEIRIRFPEVQVIMVSSHTSEGADITLQAMEIGASDFILKEENAPSFLLEGAESFKTSLITKIKRTYRTTCAYGNFNKPETKVINKKDIIKSAQNLIIPGRRPLCFPIASEERNLGHLLLLVRSLKQIKAPILFKIMVPDIFLTSLIKSFERGNPRLTYLKTEGHVQLEPDTAYLMGENHCVHLSDEKGKLCATFEKREIKTSINQFFEILEKCKLPNTPFFLIGDDKNSDGISRFYHLTHNGIPTVFIAKNYQEFLSEENNLANKILDVNSMTAFVNHLFI